MGRAVLGIWAVVLLAGGIAGGRSGSRGALWAGAASAAAVLVGLATSLAAPATGFWIGAIATLLVAIGLTVRLAEGSGFHPEGTRLLVGLAALVLITYFALDAQGKL